MKLLKKYNRLILRKIPLLAPPTTSGDLGGLLDFLNEPSPQPTSVPTAAPGKKKTTPTADMIVTEKMFSFIDQVFQLLLLSTKVVW